MKSLSLIKPYFVENRWLIAAGFACLIIVDGLQLFIPRVIKWAIDDLTTLSADHRRLVQYALYIAAIGVFIGTFRYLWRRFLLGTSRKVEEGLRNRLFDHVQSLSPAYFDRSQAGNLMALATNDIQQVRMATGMGLVAINDAVVLGAAAIGFMAYIHVRLTLYVLLPMPFIVIGTRILGRKMHRRYTAVQTAFADLTESVRERYAGIRIIKAYNREQASGAFVESVSNRYVDSNLKLVKITGAFFPLMLLFTNLSLGIVIVVGGRQTILHNITPGDFVAFISYLGLLTWPMMAMGWVTNLIQRGRASLERIDAILKTPPDIENGPRAVRLDPVRGHLTFEHVCFAYHKKPPPVLSDIDLEIKPGETLGIVGPPGSGKSTLLNLIPRLYDVNSGCIRLDGLDIRQADLTGLRGAMAMVSQEPFVFAGSIGNNITLKVDGHAGPRLKAAAQKAFIWDTIQSLPDTFDTPVGERGIILSGGQKQRIALARALYSNRCILLLDDPISQVDMDTGLQIITTLRTLSGNRTMIITSHRLSALSWADRILSLEHGKMLEYGTHEELLANDRYYARAFKLQEKQVHES